MQHQRAGAVMESGRSIRLAVAVAMGAGLLAGGCGGAGSDAPGASADPASPPEETPSADAVIAVFAVFLTEYTIDMPGVIDAGERNIRVTNQGVEDHNLRIMRAGSEEIVWQTDGNVGSGLTQESTLDLTPGSYLVVCDFAGHDSRGMFMEVEVREVER